MHHFTADQVKALVKRAIGMAADLYADESVTGYAGPVELIADKVVTDLRNETEIHLEGAYPSLDIQTFVTQQLSLLLLDRPDRLTIRLWGCDGGTGDPEDAHIHAEVMVDDEILSRTVAPTLDLALASLSMGTWAGIQFGDKLPPDAPDWLKNFYQPMKKEEPADELPAEFVEFWNTMQALSSAPRQRRKANMNQANNCTGVR